MIWQGIFPGEHSFRRFHLPVSKEMAYLGPTIHEVAVSYGAESAASHPDPARGTWEMFIPKVVAGQFGFTLGDSVRTTVLADGLDDWGYGTTQSYKPTIYFDGEVDGVRRRRSKGSAFSARAVGQPGPGSVAGTWSQVRSDGVLRVFDDTGTVDSNGAPKAVTSTFNVILPVPLVNGATSEYMSGRYRGGTLRVGAVIGPSSTYNGSPQAYLTVGGTTGKVVSFQPTPNSWVPVRVTVYDIPPDGHVDVVVMALEEGAGRPDGYNVTVTASDWLAKAGRATVSAEPFPVKTAYQRIQEQLLPHAIYNLMGFNVESSPWRDMVGYEVGGYDVMNSALVRPLDSDSRTMLDIFRRTVAAVGRTAISMRGGIGPSWGLAAQNRISVSNGVAILNPDRGYTTEIPARAVPDSPLSLTADRVATRVSATWSLPATDGNPYGAEEVDSSMTQLWAATTYGVIERRIETDAYSPDRTTQLHVLAPGLWQKMQLMLTEQAVPEFYFEDSTVILRGQLSKVRGLAELIDHVQRIGRPIRFVGELQSDIEREHRTRGGRFGFRGGQWYLELDIEPVGFSGAQSATYAQAKARPDFTLASARTITLRDMRGVTL